ncbi:unnamed protein product [Pleuronectes platessa]|uniref:Uncharacterized protein n=1 Tax=Pleuronectes platessa TaxID=8262 RepID=A0A9N7VSI7_PLEPL|nr:unnamed protein product [Pleuronectes platessa]
MKPGPRLIGDTVARGNERGDNQSGRTRGEGTAGPALTPGCRTPSGGAELTFVCGQEEEGTAGLSLSCSQLCEAPRLACDVTVAEETSCSPLVCFLPCSPDDDVVSTARGHTARASGDKVSLRQRPIRADREHLGGGREEHRALDVTASEGRA